MDQTSLSLCLMLSSLCVYMCIVYASEGLEKESLRLRLSTQACRGTLRAPLPLARRTQYHERELMSVALNMSLH